MFKLYNSIDEVASEMSDFFKVFQTFLRTL